MAMRVGKFYAPVNQKSKRFRIDLHSRLNADARGQLASIVPNLKYNPKVKVNIYGYSDNIGVADANLALSQKRADRVKEFLVQQGIPPKQIIAKGRGESNFIATNNTKAGREQNRRIEIVPIP